MVFCLIAILLPHAQLYGACASCLGFGSVISNTMKITQHPHKSKALITHFSKGTKCTQQELESIKHTGPDLSP